MQPVVGIDVSKGASVGQAFLKKNTPYGKLFHFEHTKKGLQDLANLLQELECKAEQRPWIILEATGHYHIALVTFLQEHEYVTVVVNPLMSQRARKISLRKVKTDAHDAFLLAELFYKEEFEPYKQKSEQLFSLRLLTRHHESNTVQFVGSKLAPAIIKQSDRYRGELIGDSILATAILDRLLHHSHIVNIRGNSYPKKKAAEGMETNVIDVQQDEKGQTLYATIGFKGAYVFDVSQTEGQPLPESIVRRLTGECPIYTDLLAACPFPVRELDNCDGANGYYRRKEKDIAILASLPEKQKVKTLIHEWSHGLLHGDDATRPARRDVRELEAESTAFVVCITLGVDTSDYSFGYVASWAEEESVTLLKTCGNRIQKAAHEILDLINGVKMGEFEAV